MSFVFEVEGEEGVDDLVGDDGAVGGLVVLDYAVGVEGVGYCAAEFEVDASGGSLFDY